MVVCPLLSNSGHRLPGLFHSHASRSRQVIGAATHSNFFRTARKRRVTSDFTCVAISGGTPPPYPGLFGLAAHASTRFRAAVPSCHFPGTSHHRGRGSVMPVKLFGERADRATTPSVCVTEGGANPLWGLSRASMLRKLASSSMCAPSRVRGQIRYGDGVIAGSLQTTCMIAPFECHYQASRTTLELTPFAYSRTFIPLLVAGSCPLLFLDNIRR